MCRIGLEPRVVGRLGSRVWVSASFQIFALTAGRMSHVRREIVREGMSGGVCPRYVRGGKCPALIYAYHLYYRRVATTQLEEVCTVYCV